jgi:hypothetical protein
LAAIRARCSARWTSPPTTIEANPSHAQALAWHGAATLYYSSTNADLSALDRIGLFQRATKEMDSAVGIAPDDIRVRMARGVVLRMLTPTMPRLANVPGLIENARLDYQRMFELQQGQLEKLSQHALGELLQGLAELNSRQGKTSDAEKYYGMIQSMLKGTGLRRARGRMDEDEAAAAAGADKLHFLSHWTVITNTDAPRYTEFPCFPVSVTSMSRWVVFVLD